MNNRAASPFAQPAAFGNNRRRPGALYTWALGLLAGHSALDARPYSFTAERAAKPDYSKPPRTRHVPGAAADSVAAPQPAEPLRLVPAHQ